ncbi:hypothetical protein BH10ACT11_BH10ACT11_08750 [soil metagenome]
MIGAGTIINPIVKIVTAVAILAAISIFVVKPILDTTENVSRDSQRRSQQIQRQSQRQSEKIHFSVSRTQALAQVSVAKATGDKKRAARIINCVHQAKTVSRMDLCRAK